MYCESRGHRSIPVRSTSDMFEDHVLVHGCAQGLGPLSQVTVAGSATSTDTVACGVAGDAVREER